MSMPNPYIPDWTEQDGPYEEIAVEEKYGDLQELQDEEQRYEEKHS